MKNQRYFSASTTGFYFYPVHKENIPEDSKPIDDELYFSLLGKEIVADENGMPIEKPIVPPTLKELGDEFIKKLDFHLDSVAQDNGYDNRNTFYMRSMVRGSPYYKEGLAFAKWMDTCYQTCIEASEKIKSGDIEYQEAEEIFTSLPVFKLEKV